MKYLELNDTELGYLLTSITSAMAVIDENGHSLLRPKYQALYDKVYTVKTSCPAPVLVPSSDKGGAPSLLFTEIHVDPDLPFCEFCELAQLNLDVFYSCQCKEVF